MQSTPLTQFLQIFLVCFIESTFRVQVNLTRIGIFNGADFKFRHMPKILTTYGRKTEGFAQGLMV